jgi:predicted ATP-dependent endonuclease of OLD family
MYCLNRIVFASSDNAISQINIGGMRLNNYKVTPWTRNDESDVSKTRIIGGKNGSGKTSLLKAIELVCNLLQKEKITLEDNQKVAKKINNMNIRILKLQFSFQIGGFHHFMEMKERFTTLFDTGNLDTNFEYREDCYSKIKHNDDKFVGASLDHPEWNVVLSSIVSVEFSRNDNDDCEIKWKRGHLLSPYIDSNLEPYEHFYPKTALLIDKSHNSELAKFRTIQNPNAVNEFIMKAKEANSFYDDFSFQLDNYAPPEEYRIPFQQAKFIDVDRTDLQKEINELRDKIPELVNKHQQYLQDPTDYWKRLGEEKVLTHIHKRMSKEYKNFKLYKKLGDSVSVPRIAFGEKQYREQYYGDPLQTSAEGVFPTEKQAKSYIVGKFMENSKKWFSFSEKEHVIRDERLDVMSNYIECSYEGNIPHESDVKWMLEDRMEGVEPSEGPVKLIRALKNPNWKKMYGVDEELAEILIRLDHFFAVVSLTSSYLTSGQKQLLSLVLGVKKIPIGTLILIDEPEISLHVDWQVDLIEQLQKPLFSSRLIIATHSPDIALNHNHLCSIIATKPKDAHLED